MIFACGNEDYDVPFEVRVCLRDYIAKAHGSVVMLTMPKRVNHGAHTVRKVWPDRCARSHYIVDGLCLVDSNMSNFDP